MDDLASKSCKFKCRDKNLVYEPHPSGGKLGVLTKKKSHQYQP